jgi:GDP-4-dehydro-6-deoxy-D-mannose reductase
MASAVTVLVTGAAGFMGRHVLRAVTEAGHEGIGLIRECEADDAPSGERIVRQEWSAEGALARLLDDLAPAAVVHCAGHNGRFAGAVDPRVLHEANVVLTERVLAAAVSASRRPRVVLVSSAAVYGSRPPVPTREDAPVAPDSEYGASKAAAERLCSAFHARGVAAIVARPFNIVGPGEPFGSVVETLARQMLSVPRGGAVCVRLRETVSVRDFIDVRDVARGLVILASGGTAGLAYNVCTGRGVGVEELARRAMRVWEREATFEVAESEVAGTVSVGDPALLAALGWRPRITLDETLAAVADRLERRAR